MTTMLHEILLSLSGHRSPLLRRHGYSDGSAGTAGTILTAPERDLLQTAGHLSELHCNLISYTERISESHPSVICRAVSTAISSVQLAAFRRKILQVESSILRNDAGLVGAYHIVPLTAVMAEFSAWTRTMEFLWRVVQFMSQKDRGSACTSAMLINKLRQESQTGYADVEETSLALIKVAETAWLKQVSAWVLYGRVPIFGAVDFFIQKNDDSEQGYTVVPDLVPCFVNGSSASSMLFIGTSLHRIRARSAADASVGGIEHFGWQLEELSKLTFPLNTAAFSRTITSIRLFLSRTTLQKLLPIERVAEILQLLRQFFLLKRGEFAMALTQQADDKMRSRWRGADKLADGKRDGVGTSMVKEGEVTAVLGQTWAVLSSLQSQHADEDEQLELARDLIRLELCKPGPDTTATTCTVQLKSIAPTPFMNLLFSVPVMMTFQIRPPLDLFLGPSDIQIYTRINSYLLSIRRAHLRLTDLWKITSLRRQHPAGPRPPYSNSRGGKAKTRLLRQRWSARSRVMRSAWATSSAMIFFLAETEAYLQVEVVEGIWEDFHSWLVGKDASSHKRGSRPPTSHGHRRQTHSTGNDHTAASGPDSSSRPDDAVHVQAEEVTAHHDPQTLAVAHRIYLGVLSRRLLLTQSTFTEPLYQLLRHVDHLIGLVHRLQTIWLSMDLEEDEGVVDAFSDLAAEEGQVKASMRQVQARAKDGVEEVVSVLRTLSIDAEFLAEMEDEGMMDDDDDDDGHDFLAGAEGASRYVPRRIGGIDRLLIKLDFGGWFGGPRAAVAAPGGLDAGGDEG